MSSSSSSFSSSSPKPCHLSRSVTRTILAVALVACALSLQGCQIPRHLVGYWEAAESYLTQYAYSPPGGAAGDANATALLSSCTVPDIPQSLRCSGRGHCIDWFDDVGGLSDMDLRLSFCKCDQYWADPECRTERKSQHVAFILSVALGWSGADQFYLGWWILGSLKSLLLLAGLVLTSSTLLGGMSLGGCGIWYIFDIVRIGSSQVATNDNFRVASDLPYFVFVLVLVGWMGVLGLAVSVWSIVHQRAKKAREILLLRAEASGSDRGSYGAEFQDKAIGMQRIPLMVSHANAGGYGRSGFAGFAPTMAPVPSFRGYGTTISGSGTGALTRI